MSDCFISGVDVYHLSETSHGKVACPQLGANEEGALSVVLKFWGGI